MAHIFEGMYLLDNAAVREDWNAAKSIVVGTLEKHGGKVLTARRWDERRLAYPIKQKNRATFLLTYYEIPAENIPDMRRDFELNESVLRSLEVVVDALPEGETEFHTEEQGAEFSVPTPPDDDHIDFVEEEVFEDEGDDRDLRRGRRDDGSQGRSDGDAKPDGDAKTEKNTDTATATADESASEDAPAETKASEATPASEEI